MEDTLQEISKKIADLISDSDGYYYIYLKPGRYKLVMRDMNYEELSTKDLDVQ